MAVGKDEQQIAHQHFHLAGFGAETLRNAVYHNGSRAERLDIEAHRGQESGILFEKGHIRGPHLDGYRKEGRLAHMTGSRQAGAEPLEQDSFPRTADMHRHQAGTALGNNVFPLQDNQLMGRQGTFFE